MWSPENLQNLLEEEDGDPARSSPRVLHRRCRQDSVGLDRWMWRPIAYESWKLENYGIRMDQMDYGY